MLNTMIVVKMKKTNYTEWKKLFDGDAEMRAKVHERCLGWKGR